MQILSGHNSKVHTLAFSPDSQTLASVAGRGRRIWLWDLAHGKQMAYAQHTHRVVHVAFSPTRPRHLAWSDSAGRILLWDLESDRQRRLDHVAPYPNQQVKLAFSPDGQLLAGLGVGEGSDDLPVYYRPAGGVSLWEWRRGQGGVRQVLPTRWGYMLTSLAFAPDSRTLAASSLNRTVQIWDVETRQLQGVLFHGVKTHFVAYSPDGRSLASASPNRLVKVWHAQSGQKRTTLKGQGKFLHALAYSPDGRTLATASGDGTVRFWDVETGRFRTAFDWQIGAVHSVAFALDGMRAAAGGEGDIIVWDIDDWAL